MRNFKAAPLEKTFFPASTLENGMEHLPVKTPFLSCNLGEMISSKNPWGNTLVITLLKA